MKLMTYETPCICNTNCFPLSPIYTMQLSMQPSCNFLCNSELHRSCMKVASCKRPCNFHATRCNSLQLLCNFFGQVQIFMQLSMQLADDWLDLRKCDWLILRKQASEISRALKLSPKLRFATKLHQIWQFCAEL